MTTPYRWLAGIAMAVLVGFGLLSYRTHLIDTGYAAGVQAEVSKAQEARLLASRSDALAAERSAASTAAKFAALKDSYDRVARDTATALAASNLRAVRLSADLARLHDEAAGLRAGIASAAGAPVGAPGASEADYSVADLIQTTNENYSICLRNSARLAEIQLWYSGLLKSDKTAPEK